MCINLKNFNLAFLKDRYRVYIQPCGWRMIGFPLLVSNDDKKNVRVSLN